MTVTFDSAGAGAFSAGSAAALTESHTIGTGANRLLLCWLAVGHSSATSVTTWTRVCALGGTVMTSLLAVDIDGGTSGFMELFGLLSPASGAQTVTASATKSGVTPASLIVNSTSYVGVGSVGTPVTTGGSAAISLAVPSAVGNMATAGLVSGSPITGGLQTSRYLENVNDATRGGNLYVADAAGASSVTFGATENDDDFSMIGVNLIAAVTAVANTNRFFALLS